MNGIQARDYQQQAIDDVVASWASDSRVVCLTMPTGAGKTATAALLMAKMKREMGDRFAFITDRLSLIGQTVQTMRRAGLKIAVVQGANTSATEDIAAADVVVCSAQTLDARGLTPDDLDVSAAIIDECHIERAVIRDWMDCPSLMIAGLTATPIPKWMTMDAVDPKDEETIRVKWHRLITALTTRAAIDSGWLVEPLFRADVDDPSKTAHVGPPTGAGGDWSETQAEAIMSPHLEVIVDAWEKMIADPKADAGFDGKAPQTIVQACSIGHSRKLAEAFTSRTGYRFEAVTADVGSDESERLIQSFRAGEIKGVVSVAKLSIGFDAPNAACLVSARPTKTFVTWVQLVGRIMRNPTDGERYSVVLDTAGNGHRHAFELHNFWDNGHSWTADERTVVGRKKNKNPGPVVDPPVCPDHPNIVQAPNALVCCLPDCHRPLPRREATGKPSVWTNKITLKELSDSVINMARKDLMSGAKTMHQARKWARNAVKILTGVEPTRQGWPTMTAMGTGPTRDKFEVPAKKKRGKSAGLDVHPVIKGAWAYNLKALQEWLDTPEEQRPEHPDYRRIALADAPKHVAHLNQPEGV